MEADQVEDLQINFFESIKDILASIGKDDLVADKGLQQVVEESIETSLSTSNSCMYTNVIFFVFISYPFFFSSIFYYYYDRLKIDAAARMEVPSILVVPDGGHPIKEEKEGDYINFSLVQPTPKLLSASSASMGKAKRM